MLHDRALEYRDARERNQSGRTRSGPGGIGVAVKILLVSGMTFPADYSARTIKGENVSSAAFGSYVVYKPPREEFNRRRARAASTNYRHARPT